MKLTTKQKKFCEYYLQIGNASEAARRAGYSEKTAPSVGAENLRKPQIHQYIAERQEKNDKEMIADSNEVLRFYTEVMRGNIKDQFGLEASLSDRLKAGDSLMKRYAAASDKSKDAVAKLDNLLAEFKDAIKSETD